MSNPILDMIQRQNAISQALRNPDELYQRLMKTDPRFKQFVEDNKNKSVDQIAQENGIDINTIRQLIR